VGGTGTLTVTDSLLWTGGSMTDGGTTIIPADATMTIDGSGINVSRTPSTTAAASSRTSARSTWFVETSTHPRHTR
jgi:hypothetical protein